MEPYRILSHSEVEVAQSLRHHLTREENDTAAHIANETEMCHEWQTD